MKASLDTNVLIHLYSANKEGLVFDFFEDGVLIYEQIRKIELNNHDDSIKSSTEIKLDELYLELMITKIEIYGIQKFEDIIHSVREEKVSIKQLQKLMIMLGFGILTNEMKEIIQKYIIWYKGEEVKIEVTQKMRNMKRKRLKELVEKITFDKYIQQIEELTSSKYEGTIFDSNKSDLRKGYFNFNNSIIGKQNLIFLFIFHNHNITLTN